MARARIKYDRHVPVIPTKSELRAIQAARWERQRRARGLGLGWALAYPICDGSGVALLLVMPPLLFLLSLPVFDWIAIVDPFRRADWALGLLALPIFLPLLCSFAMVLGYTLLAVGQMMVTSALGEWEQPPWPEWNSQTISEGLGRWLWAALWGLALGGFPIVAYWIECGKIDWFDRVIMAELVILGAGYAQVALAASLLHETLVAANPLTVLAAIGRIGWGFLRPCLVGGIVLLASGGFLWVVLFRAPSFRVAAAGLWGFWVMALYGSMVALRVLGVTYYLYADALGWFRGRPRWTCSSRSGRIYSNS
jgi:hypothetical protein